MQIIDRRLNQGNKSLENRQRFLRRAKAHVQRAVREATAGRDIPDILEGGEISIPAGGIDEPQFRPGAGGIRDEVMPGNRTFSEGDVIPRRDGEGGGANSAGDGGEATEDAFRFMLSREEFLDIFLDDLELPDLAKRKLKEVATEGVRRAGYSVSGSPASLAVTRTMRIAMSRRIALGRPAPHEMEALQEELTACEDDGRRAFLEAEIAALAAKMRRIPYIDPIDIRYRRFENRPKPMAQAVMFCLMDVSGSMSEHMKDLAKRFYMLLYIFLTRRYNHVEIVFIRHTDRAEEVDEQTFFYNPATGGTVVSSALEAMRRIIAERYRPQDWNIYAAQASDGDNFPSDNEVAARLLRDEILPVCQYFAYLEVGEAGRDPSARPDSTLWRLYERLRAEGQPLATRKVGARAEIYPVFRDLFQRREAERAGS